MEQRFLMIKISESVENLNKMYFHCDFCNYYKWRTPYGAEIDMDVLDRVLHSNETVQYAIVKSNIACYGKRQISVGALLFFFLALLD